jgi:hypothetical protein
MSCFLLALVVDRREIAQAVMFRGPSLAQAIGLQEYTGMTKNTILAVAVASIGAAPMLAMAAVHQGQMFPPGPSLWSFIMRLIGA